MPPEVIPPLYILISVISNTNNKGTFMQVPKEILGDAQLYLRQH
jgi:hypothetical protein